MAPKATLDLAGQGMQWSYPVECFGYSGDHILWIGLSFEKYSEGYLSDYSPQTNELRELKQKRIRLSDGFSYQMKRIGKFFYFTGEIGYLMRLSVELE